MSTSSSPGTSAARSGAAREGRRRPRALAVLLLLAIGDGAAAQEQVAAVWKKEELLFTYQSSIAIYSCESLRRRVASILYAVGARPDLEIKVTNCSTAVLPAEATTVDRARRPSQPRSGTSYLPLPADRQQVSTVQVLLSMPVEMTPDVVEDLKADKSRRELISRVTGNPIPRFDDPVPFAAERRVVTLSYNTIGIEAAECELLEQLVASSFKTLGLRVTRRGYSCDRYRVSNIRPTLDVEALVPATFESRETKQPPAEAGDEPEAGAPAPSEEAPAEPAADKPSE